jgi:hypothetical protein
MGELAWLASKEEWPQKAPNTHYPFIVCFLQIIAEKTKTVSLNWVSHNKAQNTQKAVSVMGRREARRSQGAQASTSEGGIHDLPIPPPKGTLQIRPCGPNRDTICHL